MSEKNDEPETMTASLPGTKPINWADKSGENTLWFTPPEIVEATNVYFDGPIPLDPATTAENPTKAKRFFTEADDGLKQRWNEPVFVNPPYSKVEGTKIPTIRLWAAKIDEEAGLGTTIIALLPCGARFSTGYWQDHILTAKWNAVTFIKGRLHFIDGRTGQQMGANTYDSMLYGYNVDTTRWMKAFGKLGATFRVERLHEQDQVARVGGPDRS